MYRGSIQQMGQSTLGRSRRSQKAKPPPAKELEEYFQTGHEEDDLYGVVKRNEAAIWPRQGVVEEVR